jgi:hypothetical protein
LFLDHPFADAACGADQRFLFALQAQFDKAVRV